MLELRALYSYVDLGPHSSQRLSWALSWLTWRDLGKELITSLLGPELSGLKGPWGAVGH